jgi:hypothetical protein
VSDAPYPHRPKPRLAARLPIVACLAALAACGTVPGGSTPPSAAVAQVWVAVLGTSPPEPLLLQAGGRAWDGYGGVVAIDAGEPVSVSLVGQETCREYLTFTADPGTNWIVRIQDDATFDLDDWTGRPMEAGPGLVERDPRECEATIPSPSPSEAPSASPASAIPAPPAALILPAFITERAPLPWCGHERVDRRVEGDFYDGAVRQCFLAAVDAGEPAEFVSDGLTMEGGRTRSIYRSLGDGAFEVLADHSGDPFATMAGWARAMCTSLVEAGVDPAGVQTFVAEECSEAVPIEAEPSSAQATADELRIFEALIAFAEARDPAAAEMMPWADQVLFGLADQVLVVRGAEELEDPASWVLDREAFRARVGPFSALEILAGWRGSGVDSISELTASAGPHPHCASPPVAAPPDLEGLRRVSVQPAGTSSCLSWWTVDLYFDHHQRVAGVTLDLFEP